MAGISDKDKERTQEQEESLARQRKSRQEGKSRRAVRKLEKEALASASSSRERRQIKKDFEKIQESVEEGAIFNVNTGELSTNQGSLRETIDDDGIDRFDDVQESGVPDGFEELDVTICVSGSPVNGSILFRES